MRRRMANKVVGVAVALAAVGSIACGSVETTSGRASAGITSAPEMRSFLEEAQSAASDYGRKHLGHYLKLDGKALRKNGLDVPPQTRLVVQTNHEGYCLEASSSQMPAEDEWAKATLSSGFEGVSNEDRCRL